MTEIVSKKKKSGMSWTPVVVVAIASFLFYAKRQIRKNYWYAFDESTITAERFRSNTTFIRHDIPTTYYKKGHLADALPEGGWLNDRGDAGLRLLRLEPGEEPLDFDYSLLDGDIGAKKLVECEGEHGIAWCPGSQCFEPELLMTQLDGILNGTSDDHYAAFSYISQSGVDHLEKALELPFKLNRGHFEQAFVSNLKKDSFVTMLHANTVTHSLAVQAVGSKYWVFFRREDYTEEHGFACMPTVGACFASKGPSVEKMDYWTYQSQPGDLLYFPPSYAHAVATAAGPNVMINFRRFFPHQFFTNHPFLSLTMIYNIFFNSEPTEDVYKLAENHELDGRAFRQAAGHANKMTKDAFNLIGEAVCFDKSPGNMDRRLATMMWDFIESTK